MSKFLISLVLLLTMLLLSAPVLASTGKIPWHLYLIGITIISTIIAILITQRKKDIETFGIRVLVAGIYFWVITFLQLGILATIWWLS